MFENVKKNLRNWIVGDNVYLGTEKDFIDKVIPKLKGGNYYKEDGNSISTVYTSVKILAETVSRLPLNVYKVDPKNGRIVNKEDYRYKLLHSNPNNYTTSMNFFATLERHRNIKGNAFCLIHRNNMNGRVEYLEILPPSRVKNYNITNNELYYVLYGIKDNGTIDTGKEIVYNSNDILHFRMLTNDGVWGINPLEALRLNLSTSSKAYQTIDKFYENNGFWTKGLKSTISGANQPKVIEAAKKFRNEYNGYDKAGELIILPPNMEIQDFTLNLADAQFIETIKFNDNKISSLYGVPPHLVGNFEASKFNNVEQLALNFKVNTIAPILRMYRQELEFKLLTEKERNEGVTIEFNSMAMVETDHKTRMEGYKALSNVAGITPNEILKLEGMETFEGGDQHFIMSNMMAAEHYYKKQELELEKLRAELEKNKNGNTKG